jgi:hypothetical protein
VTYESAANNTIFLKEAGKELADEENEKMDKIFTAI